MVSSDINKSPRGVRLHIAFFGKSNVGKSSLINALTGQDLAIVSPVPGTTTDPVYKAMEILPLGPCELIDTAGLDDHSELGHLRVKKSLEVLRKTDIAVFVADATQIVDAEDEKIIAAIRSQKIPLIIAVNKADRKKPPIAELENRFGVKVMPVSATAGEGVRELIFAISESLKDGEDRFRVIADLVEAGDCVVLVTPIDASAPKGRIILPQQHVIRDLLDAGAMAFVTREHELAQTLAKLKNPPKMVVTDSQAFAMVNKITPADVPLTSFSILFARLKGDLMEMVKGARAIENLKDGDKILIAEACTHHLQDDDIGRVKIPRWLKQKTGKELTFEYVAGNSFGDDLSDYALVIHCGACMINRAEMLYRINRSRGQGVPVINYGILIAYVHGILERALAPFPAEKLAWEQGKNNRERAACEEGC